MYMEMVKKTINFDIDMVKKIEELAKEAERDFSGEIRFIIKEYLRVKEGK